MTAPQRVTRFSKRVALHQNEYEQVAGCTKNPSRSNPSSAPSLCRIRLFSAVRAGIIQCLESLSRSANRRRFFGERATNRVHQVFHAGLSIYQKGISYHVTKIFGLSEWMDETRSRDARTSRVASDLKISSTKRLRRSWWPDETNTEVCVVVKLQRFWRLRGVSLGIRDSSEGFMLVVPRTESPLGRTQQRALARSLAGASA